MTGHKPDVTRRPKDTYRNNNGFMDEARARVQGTTRLPNLHASTADLDASKVAEHQRAVRDAVERRRFAEDVLLLKGSYFPGVATAKELNEQAETATYVKERINDLRKRHLETMQKVYEWQADDHNAEARDRYLPKDDAVTDSQTDAFYHSLHGPYPHEKSVFDDAVSSLRYAHLDNLSGLRRQHAALAAKEEEERRRRDAQFPADLATFHAIQSKDTQLRIAKFLTSDNQGKERMLSEYRWAWRQVKNLTDEFKTNETFEAEIKALLRELETHDPRRRPTGS
ncbi:uncharacterized protein C8Q71DRAFT_702884 [Rhodofomes roseus]|uniref:Uncharacterized protein n=1 Tax=Rhodofomes roseus TaxID=34475 RepID=A0ABQ8KPB0_9APHY|nr:uncharacterized protein C8Q71DRAFT_702884 [Rhodofomes roseus]KAH9839998.1 hypothetical protein C8Q71DRAFT_702884 [Rhodofomes roseus]